MTDKQLPSSGFLQCDDFGPILPWAVRLEGDSCVGLAIVWAPCEKHVGTRLGGAPPVCVQGIYPLAFDKAPPGDDLNFIDPLDGTEEAIATALAELQ